jgi:integrase
MRIKLLDGSGVIELRYVFEDMDRHGNVRIYVRKGRKGTKIRLRESVGSAAFLAEYRRAIDGTAHINLKRSTPAAPGTLGWLIETYYRAPEFRHLKSSTQSVRRRILDGLRKRKGANPLALMEPRHVRELRDEKADTPAAANVLLKILKAVFKWACEADLMQKNPARDVPPIKFKSDGFHPWTEAEVQRYEVRHAEGTKARLALALLLYLGVRRSDAVILGRQLEQDGNIRFRQTKTGKWLTIPILPALRAEIDRHPSQHLTYLVTEYGRSFTAPGFGNWFRDRCDEAGLTHCSAHGLRKAGATRAANNGATAHQLKAVFGWAGIEEAELYTRTADQQRLAGSGIHYLARGQKVDK